MTIPPTLFPVLLTTHVAQAVSPFLPAFLLAFTMRTRGADGEPVAGAIGIIGWLMMSKPTF